MKNVGMAYNQLPVHACMSSFNHKSLFHVFHMTVRIHASIHEKTKQML